MTSSNDIVTLDVGGHIYRTTVSTLTRYPDSMLGAMFGGDSVAAFRDDQGRYFIDRDGTLFRHVLNFLRTSQLALPEDFKELPLLEIEADFYQIQPLIEALASYKARFETSPCEFEVVFLHLVPYRIGSPEYLSVSSSSSEVRDKVNGFVQAIKEENPSFTEARRLPALIARLHDDGFTVQSHNVALHKEGQIGTQEKWVLVRKVSRNSPHSKCAIGKS